MFDGKWDGNFKKDRESNGESNVWCKADGEKENRGPDGDVRIEGNSGLEGKGEWSEMVQACVAEGWWARSEKSIGVWSEGQEKARTTEEDYLFFNHTSPTTLPSVLMFLLVSYLFLLMPQL